MSNRIASAIARARIKLDALEPEQREKIDQTLALEPMEAFEYQQTQARAHAAGILTTDEALIIYASIGESAQGWRAGTDTATKVIAEARAS